MRTLVLFIFLGLIVPRAGEAGSTLAGDAILDEVVRRLPHDEINVRGEILTRRRRGIPVERWNFEAQIHWGAIPPRAFYRVFDAFGRELEALELIRLPDGRIESDFSALRAVEDRGDTFDMQNEILGTDLTWLDMSFSFLWWRGARIQGHEDVLNRRCVVLDVPSPDNSSQYTRLWIDEELFMLLRAEMRGHDDEVERRMWIRSFRKIDERWFIRDMEIDKAPWVRRTRLRVEEVKGFGDMDD